MAGVAALTWQVGELLHIDPADPELDDEQRSDGTRKA
jgi:hypothetical protein